MIRYASPTFLFRDRCPRELEKIMQRLARCGFEGLELYGMFGYDSAAIRGFCRSSGLRIVCDHIHYAEFVEQPEAVINARASVGAQFLTVDNLPEDALPGQPGFPETVRQLERLGRLCRAAGVQLLYHNHGYDLMRQVQGTPVLDLILDALDPELLKFQPDLGWLVLGGGDPVRYLEKYRDRCPIIHLKDFYASAPIRMESPFLLGKQRGGPEYHHFEFRPSGYGVMNFPQLMPAVLACHPKWITTDHDESYERNTYEDMQMSLTYVRKLVDITKAMQINT